MILNTWNLDMHAQGLNLGHNGGSIDSLPLIPLSGKLTTCHRAAISRWPRKWEVAALTTTAAQPTQFARGQTSYSQGAVIVEQVSKQFMIRNGERTALATRLGRCEGEIIGVWIALRSRWSNQCLMGGPEFSSPLISVNFEPILALDAMASELGAQPLHFCHEILSSLVVETAKVLLLGELLICHCRRESLQLGNLSVHEEVTTKSTEIDILSRRFSRRHRFEVLKISPMVQGREIANKLLFVACVAQDISYDVCGPMPCDELIGGLNDSFTLRSKMITKSSVTKSQDDAESEGDEDDDDDEGEDNDEEEENGEEEELSSEGGGHANNDGGEGAGEEEDEDDEDEGEANDNSGKGGSDEDDDEDDEEDEEDDEEDEEDEDDEEDVEPPKKKKK
eukprot:Gb_36287 [translate_table: standard]